MSSEVKYTPWNAKKRKNFFSYLPPEAQPGPTEPLIQEYTTSSYEAFKSAYEPALKQWVRQQLGQNVNTNNTKMKNLVREARKIDKSGPNDPQELQGGKRRKTRKQRKSRKGTRRT